MTAATARGVRPAAPTSFQTLRILFRVQLASLRDAAGSSATSRVAALVTGLGKSLLLAALAVLVSLGIGAAYALIVPAYIPGIAVTVAALLGLIFSFSDAAGSIFGFRDYDLVMSLPISTRVVIVSRVGALFARQLMFSAVVIIPMYVVYFMVMPVSAAAVLTAAVSVLLSAALPVSVSILAAFVLAVFSSRFRYASAVYIVFGIAAALIAMFVSSAFSKSGTGDMTVSQLMSTMQVIAGAYPMAALAVAAAQGAWAELAIFAVVSIAVVAVVVEVLARTFMGINALLSTGVSKGRDVGSRRDRVSSPIWAMAVKELKYVLSLPQLAMNAAFGGVMLLILAGMAMVMGHDASATAVAGEYLGLEGPMAETVAGLIDLLVPWSFAFLLGTTSLSAVLVSMEGPAAWIMATAPIPVRDLLGAKVFAGMLWAAPVAVLSGAGLAIGGYPAVSVIAGVLIGLSSALLNATLGQLLDVMRPNYTWTAPVQVIKRSRPITVGVILQIVVAFGGGALSVLLSLKFGLLPGYAMVFAVAAVEFVAALACFNRACKTPLFLNS